MRTGNQQTNASLAELLALRQGGPSLSGVR